MPNSTYQSGMNTPDMQARMGSYEPNKDPFSNMRKGGGTKCYCRVALDNQLSPPILTFILFYFAAIVISRRAVSTCQSGPKQRSGRPASAAPAAAASLQPGATWEHGQHANGVPAAVSLWTRI